MPRLTAAIHIKAWLSRVQSFRTYTHLQQIPSLTQRRQRSQEHEKSFIGFLLILSFFVYLVGALIFYLYFLPKTWLEGAVNSLPLLLFPLV